MFITPRTSTTAHHNSPINKYETCVLLAPAWSQIVGACSMHALAIHIEGEARSTYGRSPDRNGHFDSSASFRKSVGHEAQKIIRRNGVVTKGRDERSFYQSH